VGEPQNVAKTCQGEKNKNCILLTEIKPILDLKKDVNIIKIIL